ncbi:hypothetical protein OG746_13765 [Streptomyces sp. NBC_01016]|uniref:hypothetical protein n=1 Tax=Streptomyces sp. NBC_01016 TaxID=2903720 RepID=UPI00225A77C3|nr:hypothetical protein [Streptomyces sp. NBC_01016]MCX4829798.1 hypothetical protein [Streptomyces sp. NBC_01016]
MPHQAPSPYAYAPGPAAKPPGKAQRVWGIIVLVVGVLPLLIGAGLLAANIKDARITKFNDAFAPKAWHNLESDKLFPDTMSELGTVYDNPGWVRQGIAQAAKCDEVLSGKLLQQATAGGCKTVLRATYVDQGGEAAATVSLIVLGNSAAATELADQYSETDTETELNPPGVTPYPVPKTLASGWSKRNVVANSFAPLSAGTSQTPYVMAFSVGSVDAQRSWGRLPQPWTRTQSDETEAYKRMATNFASISGYHVNQVIDGKADDDA